MAVLLLCAFWAAASAAGKLGEFIPTAAPQPAPQARLADLDGKPASLADFKGKPVVVNLWATWCPPCVKEMPTLNRLQARLEGRLIVAAVSEDRGGAAAVKRFVAAKEMHNLRVYLDPAAALAHALDVDLLPTSIVIDTEGRIVGRVDGPAVWDGAKMLAALQPFLTGAVKAPAR